MPHLQVDLDGKRKWPLVAKGLGVSLPEVSHAFLETWEMCWRGGVDRLSHLQLECLFGAPGARVAAVLEAFGFAEQVEPEVARIRGAERYLRITEARSRGGKMASGNLKRGTKLPGSSPAGAGSQPEPGPALTPITDHRSPITERSAAAPKPPPLVPQPELGFWVWAQDERMARLPGTMPQNYPPGMATWWRDNARLVADQEALKRAWVAFLGDAHWQSENCPWGAFAKFAADYFRAAGPAPPRRGVVAATAADKDWTNYTPPLTPSGEVDL